MIDFSLALYLLGTLVILLWVVFPMLAAGIGRRRTAADAANAERSQALLNSLRELYADHKRGHISDDDLPNIERRLILDLARLNHDSGIEPDAEEKVRAVAEDATSCERCGAKREGNYRYCPSCGAGFIAA
ncbi:MAG: hypothetical protein QNK37_06085 [Acidobacteriota bacterium]|nr:hypothetical protein [Acidobacteriota bacterium]